MSATSDWITVGALADGFMPEAFLLPHVEDFAGKTHVLHFARGGAIEHRFEADQLHWHAADGHSTGSAPYRATALRPGIYLVDFVKHERGRHWSISLVIDVSAQVFTAVIGALPSEADTQRGLYGRALAGEPLTGVQAQILHGSLDDASRADSCHHQPTDQLVGLRNRYRYSPTEVYDHIYLTEQYYTWLCVKGVEQGLCDTDRCHYIAIAPDLTLFVWREKIVPTLGLVLIDLAAHRSDGKIFGYAGEDFTQVSNFPVASHCQVISRLEQPA